jgi:hypothetical protein
MLSEYKILFLGNQSDKPWFFMITENSKKYGHSLRPWVLLGHEVFVCALFIKTALLYVTS